jgi:hypothetical protein
MLQSHIEYLITGACWWNPGLGVNASRRFSDFEELLVYLNSAYPFAVFPHLPTKGLLTTNMVHETNEFLETRRRSLEYFLKKLLTHENVVADGRMGPTTLDSKVVSFLSKDKDVLQI